jgi:hypothetical protein
METFGRTMTAYGEINLGAEFSDIHDIQPRNAILKYPVVVFRLLLIVYVTYWIYNSQPWQSFQLFLLPLHRSAEIKLPSCSANIVVKNDFNDLLAVLLNREL